MEINRQLLASIGRRLPGSFDVPRRGLLNPGGERELNGQPIPPLELGASLASEVLRLVYLAERFGLDFAPVLTDIDDWCPTPPRPIKLPPWLPPIPPDEPEPGPDWFAALHFGFAARLSTGLEAFEGTHGAESLNRVIERSVGALDSLMG